MVQKLQYIISLPVSEYQGLGEKSKKPTGNQNRKIIFISFAGYISMVKKNKERPERQYSGNGSCLAGVTHEHLRCVPSQFKKKKKEGRKEEELRTQK